MSSDIRSFLENFVFLVAIAMTYFFIWLLATGSPTFQPTAEYKCETGQPGI